jgi:hypothetical protein
VTIFIKKSGGEYPLDNFGKKNRLQDRFAAGQG